MYKDIIIKAKTKCDKCDGFEKRAPFSLAQYLDVNTKTDFNAHGKVVFLLMPVCLYIGGSRYDRSHGIPPVPELPPLDLFKRVTHFRIPAPPLDLFKHIQVGGWSLPEKAFLSILNVHICKPFCYHRWK